MLRHDTACTLSEDRVRRLRELLAMMLDRHPDGNGPMIAAIRRNLALAEAANSDARSHEAGR